MMSQTERLEPIVYYTDPHIPATILTVLPSSQDYISSAERPAGVYQNCKF